MVLIIALQDLANQIAWSTAYAQSCREVGLPPNGKFLSLEMGEWFSGLPAGWTSLEQNAVDKQVFDQMFPQANSKASPVPAHAI